MLIKSPHIHHFNKFNRFNGCLINQWFSINLLSNYHSNTLQNLLNFLKSKKLSNMSTKTLTDYIVVSTLDIKILKIQGPLIL